MAAKRKPRPAPTRAQVLAETTVDDLLQELGRRSLGLVAVAVLLDDAHTDTWRFAAKGSSLMLTSLHAAMSLEVRARLQRMAEEYNRDNA